MRTAFLIAATTLVLPLHPLSAQFAVGVDLGVTTINSRKAAQDSIAENGFGFRLIGQKLLSRAFTVGGDMGVSLHSDKNAHTVETTGGKRTSKGSVYEVSAWTGFQLPGVSLGKATRTRATLGAVGGYSFVWGLVNYGDCVNCGDRRISLNSGPFVEPSFTLLFRRWQLGVAYRDFLGGDMNRVVMLRLLAHS